MTTLAAHIASLATDRSAAMTSPWERVADAVMADPQGHIDALVECGVLERHEYVMNVHSESGMTRHALYLVPPSNPAHVHEFTVLGIDVIDRQDVVRLKCVCGSARAVHNRLPIEVPE